MSKENPSRVCFGKISLAAFFLKAFSPLCESFTLHFKIKLNRKLNPLPKILDGNDIMKKFRLKQGPVVLVFYRGAWCPYCNLQLRALKESQPHFERYGARLIAVTPQTPDHSLEQYKKDHLDYGLNRRSALEYHLRQVERLLKPTPITAISSGTCSCTSPTSSAS